MIGSASNDRHEDETFPVYKPLLLTVMNSETEVIQTGRDPRARKARNHSPHIVSAIEVFALWLQNVKSDSPVTASIRQGREW